MVKHRVLVFGQRCKVRKHSPGMDVGWCAAHEPVGLLYHRSDIQVVTVVEEILRGNDERGFYRGEKNRLTMGLILFLEARAYRLPQSPVSGSTEGEARGSR